MTTFWRLWYRTHLIWCPRCRKAMRSYRRKSYG